MQTTSLKSLLARAAFALAVALYAVAPLANAGVLNHGMFMGPGVKYIDVTETSSEDLPLYGEPIVIGDSLAFFEPSSPNPSLGFSAQSAGGSGDITDGFLNLTIMAKPAASALNMITFSEGGDYTMAGLGAALAQVSATMNIFELRILDVDGSSLVTPIVLSGSESATFNLPPDTGGPWSLSKTFNLKQALVDSGHPFMKGVTKITARINNTLTALSQPGSVAGIFKKDFNIDIDTELDPNGGIPEPTTLVLAVFGLVGMLAKRRAA